MIKLLPILLIFLFSCKTVKEVTKEVVKYDSTAIKENAALHRFLAEEIERFEKERETWDKTGISFYPFDAGINGGRDTIATDFKPEVPKIEFFDNGKIKSIEGRVKSLNQSLYEKSSELLDAHKTIGSLQYDLEKEQTNVKKEVTTVHKHTKTKITGWPMWLFAICLVGGLFIEWKYKLIKRILSLKLKLWHKNTGLDQKRPQ